jgi:hypothetical protein
VANSIFTLEGLSKVEKALVASFTALLVRPQHDFSRDDGGGVARIIKNGFCERKNFSLLFAVRSGKRGLISLTTLASLITLRGLAKFSNSWSAGGTLYCFMDCASESDSLSAIISVSLRDVH